MTPAAQALADERATLAQKEAAYEAARQDLIAANDRSARARNERDTQADAVYRAEVALWLERDQAEAPVKPGQHEEGAFGLRVIYTFAGRTDAGSLKTAVRSARFRRGSESYPGPTIRTTSSAYKTWCERFGIEP